VPTEKNGPQRALLFHSLLHLRKTFSDTARRRASPLARPTQGKLAELTWFRYFINAEGREYLDVLQKAGLAEAELNGLWRLPNFIENNAVFVFGEHSPRVPRGFSVGVGTLK